MHSDPRVARILTDLPTPRVWSMIVTIFGDLAQAPEDRIGGPLLTRLTDGMEIKPEAVRVALHRLRNEDWINSIKSGRTALHALTERGRRESESASPLIYSPVSALPKGWVMAMTKANDAATRATMQKAGLVQIMPRLYAGHSETKPPDTALVMRGGTAPPWVAGQVMAPELTRQCQDLLDVLRQVQSELHDSPPETPVHSAILRCLVVHHWRRLALRHPYLPPSLIGASWAGHVCRQIVTEILTMLPRPELADLDPG